MNNRKYPTSLFIIGLITNILFHFFWLFVPGVILLVLGIFFRTCQYIGVSLLFIDVVISFIEQLRIRQAFLEDSDNSDFQAFQDALSKDGNWKDNISEFLNQRISDSENELESDDDDDDDE